MMRGSWASACTNLKKKFISYLPQLNWAGRKGRETERHSTSPVQNDTDRQRGRESSMKKREAEGDGVGDREGGGGGGVCLILFLWEKKGGRKDGGRVVLVDKWMKEGAKKIFTEQQNIAVAEQDGRRRRWRHQKQREEKRKSYFPCLPDWKGWIRVCPVFRKPLSWHV